MSSCLSFQSPQRITPESGPFSFALLLQVSLLPGRPLPLAPSVLLLEKLPTALLPLSGP